MWLRIKAAPAIAAVALLACSNSAFTASEGDANNELRVCADPNNLPFSNRKGEGFESRLAEMAAEALGKKVSYTWWAQRRGFVRKTLKAQDCDVIIGVPRLMDMVETTRPYYRSTYVFLSRQDRHLNLRSIKDPRLKDLKVGIQLIGNDQLAERARAIAEGTERLAVWAPSAMGAEDIGEPVP